MKIHQLPNGARFEYEGEIYVKSGPMSAMGPSGQRLIPRYAVLLPCDPGAAAPPVAAPTASVSVTQVRAAFEAFYASCAPLVSAAAQAELAQARERFLQTIECD